MIVDLRFALGVILLSLVFSPSRAEKSAPQTVVEIRGEDFFINGQPTYAGRTARGMRIEGLLLNARLVQGIFDDRNPETRSLWNYPDGGWDPERNTAEFVAAMPAWRQAGLLSFTINLQGGSPNGYGNNKPWWNSAFDPDGSLRADYLRRLAKVLDRADELGMAPIVGLFYQAQALRFDDDAAVLRAVDGFTDWLLEKGYRHVLVEVANECNLPKFPPSIGEGQAAVMIERIQQRSKGKLRTLAGRLLVSTSFTGNHLPPASVSNVADFILLHGNGVAEPSRIRELVRRVRAGAGYHQQPILFNEDDHYQFDQPDNHFLAAVSEHASWGFFDFRRKNESFGDGFQSVPVDWAPDTSERKRGFFALVAELSGSVVGESLHPTIVKEGASHTAPTPPLRVAANGRYLEDKKGAPFFIQADTAWTLPYAYSDEEVEAYLDHRRADGFNTIQMCALFGDPQDERFHAKAFQGGDLGQPLDTYWARVDWVVEQATRRGLVVIINPIWKRHFNALLKANGPEKCRVFGHWFAARYRDNPRVLYFVGGDQIPEPVREELGALAEGIQEVNGGKAIIAFHSQADQSSREAYPAAAWLTLNWTYAYAPPYRKKYPYEENWENWGLTPPRPIQFGEGFYDFGAETKAGKNHQRGRWADRFGLRRQAWWAGPLTGAAGVAYGSEAIWMHNRGTQTWQTAVEDESGRDIHRLSRFFTSLPWWTLVPDREQSFLVGGFGRWQTDDFAVAAVSADKSMAVIYTPVRHDLELQTAQLREGKLNARWFDPTNGESQTAEIPKFNERGKIVVTSPLQNSAGLEDFVLVIGVDPSTRSAAESR